MYSRIIRRMKKYNTRPKWVLGLFIHIASLCLLLLLGHGQRLLFPLLSLLPVVFFLSIVICMLACSARIQIEMGFFHVSNMSCLKMLERGKMFHV